MSAYDEAASYADKVLSLIPQLVNDAVEERRKHACWWAVYTRHRLSTCRPIMRPMWRWLLRKREAACFANRSMAAECALASARVRMSEPA